MHVALFQRHLVHVCTQCPEKELTSSSVAYKYKLQRRRLFWRLLSRLISYGCPTVWNALLSLSRREFGITIVSVYSFILRHSSWMHSPGLILPRIIPPGFSPTVSRIATIRRSISTYRISSIRYVLIDRMT